MHNITAKQKSTIAFFFIGFLLLAILVELVILAVQVSRAGEPAASPATLMPVAVIVESVPPPSAAVVLPTQTALPAAALSSATKPVVLTALVTLSVSLPSGGMVDTPSAGMLISSPLNSTLLPPDKPLASDITLTPAPMLGQHPYFTPDLAYLLYLPPDYGKDPQKEWPLVLFLHGLGDGGRNPELLKRPGLPKLVNRGRNFDFILLSPQCPLDKYWSDVYGPVMALLDEVQSTYKVDPHRVYLTGISMGGYGAIGLAQAYPDRFAALVPIAGGYFWDPNIAAAGRYTGDLNAPIPEQICVLKNIPTWFFCGAKDTVIPASQSQHVVEALKRCGSQLEPKLTLYSDADHMGSWEQAYADPELYAWLLSQAR